MRQLLILLIFGLIGINAPAHDHTQAQASEITRLCPAVGIQQRGPDQYGPGGIVLTYFDKDSLWVYNVTTNNRYPLPETAPCGSNCNPSRDARWITYLDAQTRTFGKMRFDGTQRTPLVRYASEVAWWTEDTLLVWTPTQDAYLRPEAGEGTEPLNVDGIISVQPGGRWGLLLEQREDDFVRLLVDLESRDLSWAAEPTFLAIDQPYFNTSQWSPDGTWLAFTAPTTFDEGAQSVGTELFGIRPGDAEPTQWTDLFSIYGATRVNGQAPSELSWSPDGSKIAFWVAEMLGPNPAANAGNALIHILDVETGAITLYCGFSTTEHTPNPPRLIWSPDSTHLVFGANLPNDTRGYILLGLNTADGIFTELSVGVYPALGNADAVAWGLPPQ